MLEELIMYESILKTIEKNTDKITNAVLDEIRTRPEAWHYTVIPSEIISDRITHVVRNVYQRLGSWLRKKEPKSLLFTSFSELGAARCRQCMPMEAIAAVLLMIRREICTVIRAQTEAGNELTRDQPAEICYYVNLLFAGIMQSIIAGYRNELSVITLKRGSEKLLSKRALRI